MTQSGRPRREDEKPDSPFGKALKEYLRRVEDFTQTDLAYETAIPEKTLSHMVKGRRTSGTMLRRDLRDIIRILYQKKALLTLKEANQLITTIPAIKELDGRDPDDAEIIISYLPFPLVLAELQAVNQRLGRDIIDYLYAESLSILEQQCGKDAAHWILNAFCPLGAGDSVSYEALRTYSGIADEEVFRNTLRVACDLSLIRTSKLNSFYSIHSLLWKFVCDY